MMVEFERVLELELEW